VARCHGQRGLYPVRRTPARARSVPIAMPSRSATRSHGAILRLASATRPARRSRGRRRLRGLPT